MSEMIRPTMMRIREAAEKAKIELSNIVSTEINLPFLAYDPKTGPKNLVTTLTRAKLEDLLRPIIERCRAPMMQALADAKITPQDIDKIIMVGGPTRMPIVRQFVATATGKEPERGIDPMEAVAMGSRYSGSYHYRRCFYRYLTGRCHTSDSWCRSSGWLKRTINRTQHNHSYKKIEGVHYCCLIIRLQSQFM